jgi:hypothetical protein
MRASLLFFANAAGVEEPSTFFRSVMKNVSTRGPFQYAPFENANDAATKDRIDMTFFRLAISRSKWTVLKTVYLPSAGDLGPGLSGFQAMVVVQSNP